MYCYRIREWLRWEGTSGPTPCLSTATQSRLLRTVFRQPSVRWETPLSEHPALVLWHLHSGKVYLDVQKTLVFQFVPVASCPVTSLDTTEKSLSPSSLQPPFRNLYALVRSPLSLLFSKLNSPSFLSLFSQERCSDLLIIFMALCWTLPFVHVVLELDTLFQVWPHQC